MGSVDLKRFASPQQLAETATADCIQVLFERDQERPFTVAFAGGRIAITFCAALARQVTETGRPLRNVHFFWSDERCVPPDDPESNFRLANDSFLRPLGIPASCIHRIEGEKPPPQAFASAEADLHKLASWTAGQPVLDLLFLGIGENGHVASLFPEEPEQVINDPAVFRSVTVVKPPPRRITMGYRVIAAAQRVWVLASGEGKAAALRESLQPNGHTPLARVVQMRAQVRIYTDLPA